MVKTALKALFVNIIRLLAFVLGVFKGSRDDLFFYDRQYVRDGFIILVIQLGFYCMSASSLFQVSNHIILSLDIIYLFSILILAMFHTFKESKCRLLAENP